MKKGYPEATKELLKIYKIYCKIINSFENKIVKTVSPKQKIFSELKNRKYKKLKSNIQIIIDIENEKMRKNYQINNTRNLSQN